MDEQHPRRRPAFFTRYLDIDADGNINDAGNDWFDGSANSGWGYISGQRRPEPWTDGPVNQSNNNLLGFVTSFSGAQGWQSDPYHFIPKAAPMKRDQAVMYVSAPGV